MLHFAYKYSGDVESGLLANANAGDENVGRAPPLGALLGAANGMSAVPKHLINGLVARKEIEAEIEAFIEATLGPA